MLNLILSAKKDYPDLTNMMGTFPKLNEEYKDFWSLFLDFIDLEFKLSMQKMRRKNLFSVNLKESLVLWKIFSVS